MFIEQRIEKVEEKIQFLALACQSINDDVQRIGASADELNRVLAALREALVLPLPATPAAAQDDGAAQKPPIAVAQNAVAEVTAAGPSDGGTASEGTIGTLSEEVVAVAGGEESSPAPDEDANSGLGAGQDTVVRAAASGEGEPAPDSASQEAPPPAPVSSKVWSIEDRVLAGPEAQLILSAVHARVMRLIDRSPVTEGQIATDLGIALPRVPPVMEKMRPLLRDVGLKFVKNGNWWTVEAE